MKINGKTATTEQELDVYSEFLEQAKAEHYLESIAYFTDKVKQLKSKALDERIMKLLES